MDSPKSIPDEFGLISDLKYQVKTLEARLEIIERHGGGHWARADGGSEQAAHADGVDEGDDYGLQLWQLTNERTIPRVRKCNYAEFKNRFSEEQGCYAVDVLVSGNLMNQEIREELKLRERRTEAKKLSSRKAVTEAKALINAANQSNTKALQNAQSDASWIRRIRLQSPALIKILSSIHGETWSNRPRTYYRPFSSLIYFHPQMKKVLEELEERWGSATDVPTPATTTGSTYEARNEAPDEIDNCPVALDVMRCYVEFFERDIISEYTKFETLDCTDNPTVQFHDLWYLFRTGEFVYRPQEGDMTGQRDMFAEKRIWRAYGVKPCDTQYHLSHTDHRKYDIIPQSKKRHAFVVRAFYLDYNGEEFTVVSKSFSVMPYTGFQPVTSLPVFPLRFSPGSQELRDRAERIGEKALHYIDIKHGSYNGWTVLRSSDGELVTDSNGVVLKHPEHINSDIMIDYGEAFQACPSWKPERSILKPKTPFQMTASDDIPILVWSNTDRGKLVGEVTEVIPVRTGTSMWQRNKYVTEDALLVAMRENDNRSRLTTRQDLRREDLALVSCRVFAYVFQERKFAQLNIQKVAPASGTRDALDSLSIPNKIKDIIQSSIHGHFLQKGLERQIGEGRLSLDLIPGKGSGLFILLHGVPGVGKTATAEAIAQAYGKPLFKITCGDLGLSPDQVESSLQDIFRLANSWDCILLLDEVDTFFSRRSKGDGAIHKNALVSVFLRILDYYSGILFLTTNRVGALDEAFKSRIHLKIYYPPLTIEQTLKIWQTNLQRLRRIEDDHSKKKRSRPMEISEADILGFAATQFGSTRRGNPTWNGRQIRNAFQVARSLAYAEAAILADRINANGTTEVMPAANLDVKHFRLVHEITDEYDEYLKEVYSGMNDADLAREGEHRADHLQNLWAARPSEQFDKYSDTYGGGSSSMEAMMPRVFGRISTSGPRASGQAFAFTGLSDRYQDRRSPPPAADYDDPDASGRGQMFPPHSPSIAQHRGSQQSVGRPITVRAASPGDDYGRSNGLMISPRFPAGFAQAKSPIGRNGDHFHLRENSRQSAYEADSVYKEAVNDYGKRERVEERDPFASMGS